MRNFHRVMFRAFSVDQVKWRYDARACKSWIEAAEEMQTKQAVHVAEKLEDLLSVNGRPLDGAIMQAAWFPAIKADIFISYARADSRDALALAGWLKEMLGLESFIDFTAWRHVDDLLQRIDDKFSRDPTTRLYDYEKRNGSTSHAHMMLATALMKMIDATECAMFLNTRESITQEDSVNRTKSPWLMLELVAMSVLRRRPHRLEMKKTAARRLHEDHDRAFVVNYEVPLPKAPAIDANILKAWAREARGAPSHPLDVLYRLVSERSDSDR